MKSQTIVTILVIVLIFLGLFFWGYAKPESSTTPEQTAGPSMPLASLTAAETSYDFGTISMKNGNVSRDFSFVNQTGKDVTLRGLETSCMCTAALLINPDGSTKGPFGMAGMGGLTNLNETIKAGESRTVRVVYDPNAHGPAGVGSINRFVTVTDAAGGVLRFEIKALVTP